jgi:hypothetical protein
MQRGTVRARSPSPTGIDERYFSSPTRTVTDQETVRKRQRTGEYVSGDTSSETAVHNEESKVVATHKMGRPSNGSTSGNGAGPSNGHSSNGAGLLEHVTLAGITQRNMYPDDDDWAEQQGDVIMADGEMTVPATTQHGKRMPVDREEFVKLVLQGLRDVGYEYVLAQVKLIVDKRHLC